MKKISLGLVIAMIGCALACLMGGCSTTEENTTIVAPGRGGKGPAPARAAGPKAAHPDHDRDRGPRR